MGFRSLKRITEGRSAVLETHVNLKGLQGRAVTREGTISNVEDKSRLIMSIKTNFAKCTKRDKEITFAKQRIFVRSVAALGCPIAQLGLGNTCTVFALSVVASTVIGNSDDDVISLARWRNASMRFQAVMHQDYYQLRNVTVHSHVDCLNTRHCAHSLNHTYAPPFPSTT